MSPKSFIRTWAPLSVASLTACAVGCGSASDGGGNQYVAPSSGTSSDVPTEDASTEASPRGESSGSGSASGSSGTGSSGSSSGEADDSGSTTAPQSSGDSNDSGSVTEAGTTPPDAGPSADSGMDDCAGGKTGTSSESTQARSSYGDVEFQISTTTQITALYTTLTVPAMPPPSGTLFLWPGLQPLQNSKNYNPIGNGVLQPVLTWGSTCAPTAPNDYKSWWISAQYVNTFATYMGHTGCLGGDGMNVAVGDQLDVAMTLSGTVWTQVVTDRQTAKSVNFSLDMLGQAQNWGLFQIEVPSGREPVSDVIFTSTRITMGAADAAACQPSVHGTNDYYSAPQSSVDGKTCCVSKIILRGKGVAATSPNTP